MSVSYVLTVDAPPPFSNYSQAAEIAPEARQVHVSGQVGVTLDGTLAADARGQHAQAWANVLAILAATGMGPADIVSVTAYVTDASGVPIFREERDKVLGAARPASTLLIVAGLADPSWVVEIAVVAAKVG